jgi:hypothetical protein
VREKWASSKVSPPSTISTIPVTEHFYSIQFLLWRRSGHKYRSFDLEFLAGVSNTLRMIAGAGANNASASLLIIQSGNFIETHREFYKTERLCRVFTL